MLTKCPVLHCFSLVLKGIHIVEVYHSRHGNALCVRLCLALIYTWRTSRDVILTAVELHCQPSDATMLYSIGKVESSQYH